jgi:hypothetical protein
MECWPIAEEDARSLALQSGGQLETIEEHQDDDDFQGSPDVVSFEPEVGSSDGRPEVVGTCSLFGRGSQTDSKKTRPPLRAPGGLFAGAPSPGAWKGIQTAAGGGLFASAPSPQQDRPFGTAYSSGTSGVALSGGASATQGSEALPHPAFGSGIFQLNHRGSWTGQVGGSWPPVRSAECSVPTSAHAYQGEAAGGGSGAPINSSGPPQGGARRKRSSIGVETVDSDESSPAKKTQKSKRMKTGR